jgi:hypothetical protein
MPAETPLRSQFTLLPSPMTRPVGTVHVNSNSSLGSIGTLANSSTLRSDEQLGADMFGKQITIVEGKAASETIVGSLITGGLDLRNGLLIHDKNLRIGFGPFGSLLIGDGDGEAVERNFVTDASAIHVAFLNTNKES